MWRESVELTKKIQYPGYPRPGTGWIVEFALGTNPKIDRPHGCGGTPKHSGAGLQKEDRLGDGPGPQWSLPRRVRDPGS